MLPCDEKLVIVRPMVSDCTTTLFLPHCSLLPAGLLLRFAR